MANISLRPGDVISLTLAGWLGCEIGDNEGSRCRTAIVLTEAFTEGAYTLSVVVPIRDAAKYVRSAVNRKAGTPAEAEPTLYPGEFFLPANSGGLTKDSIALVSQVRAVDLKLRFKERHGRLDPEWILILRQEVAAYLAPGATIKPKPATESGPPQKPKT